MFFLLSMSWYNAAPRLRFQALAFCVRALFSPHILNSRLRAVPPHLRAPLLQEGQPLRQLGFL
jgi:hypothetical protein